MCFACIAVRYLPARALSYCVLAVKWYVRIEAADIQSSGGLVFVRSVLSYYDITQIVGVLHRCEANGFPCALKGQTW